jgi:hypothetical protein
VYCLTCARATIAALDLDLSCASMRDCAFNATGARGRNAAGPATGPVVVAGRCTDPCVEPRSAGCPLPTAAAADRAREVDEVRATLLLPLLTKLPRGAVGAALGRGEGWRLLGADGPAGSRKEAEAVKGPSLPWPPLLLLLVFAAPASSASAAGTGGAAAFTAAAAAAAASAASAAARSAHSAQSAAASEAARASPAFTAAHTLATAAAHSSAAKRASTAASRRASGSATSAGTSNMKEGEFRNRRKSFSFCSRSRLWRASWRPTCRSFRRSQNPGPAAAFAVVRSSFFASAASRAAARFVTCANRRSSAYK